MNTLKSKTKLTSAFVIASIASLCFMTSTLNAQILKDRTRTGAQTYDGGTHNVQWNANPGSHIVTFNTNQPNTRVFITFNAECAVSGSESRWLDVNIMLDPAGPAAPIAIKPTNSDNALCSGNGTPLLNGWVSAVTQAAVRIPNTGQHRVWIRVQAPVGNNSARLDDMSLVILR